MDVLDEGRAMAEELMTSRVRVRRYTGAVHTDPVTGKVTRAHTVVYGDARPDQYPDGEPSKIAAYEAFEQVKNIEGATVTTSRTRVDFPVGSFKITPGDEVHVISDLEDPMLAGKVLRVTVPAPYKSHATALRCFVEEVSTGG